MAGRALTEEAMRRGLADIRLPPEAAGGLAAELLAAVALGLALALMLGLALRLVSHLPRPSRAPSRAARLRALAALPEKERYIALLHHLARENPEALARWRDRLYRPGAAPALAELEAVVAAPGSAP